MTPIEALRWAADQLESSQKILRGDRGPEAIHQCAMVVLGVRKMCTQLIVDLTLCLEDFPADVVAKAAREGDPMVAVRYVKDEQVH